MFDQAANNRLLGPGSPIGNSTPSGDVSLEW
jgi:hypothetical protein